METEVGERSRPSSDFSEFGEGVVEDHEERTVDVTNRGLGGTREAGSSGEDSYKWETSSLEADSRVRSSAFVCWRSLDMARRGRGGVGR